ncbi:MAG: alpha/beta hydrolase [Alphaproteobacteria bacterium]|nr:alpha/beta hydrolase [Alphaproteobacteria bacterium]
MVFLGSLVALGCAIALIIILGAPHLERALMYSPDPTYTKPAEAGLIGVEEETIVTHDGEKLIVWYSPPAPGQPTLLYIHGNAGSLADRAERIAAYQQFGRGMCVMSYRGYSGSTGKPSERANVLDAVKTYDGLIAKGLQPEDIIAYGESIGSGIAVQLARQRPVAGIILDAPYTSIVDVAELCYPYLPARQMMRDRYETLEHLQYVDAPMLVVHGEADRVIPVEMGRKVAAQAPGVAEIVTFPEAGHSDHYSHGSFEAINSWIDRLREGRAKPVAVA